MVTGADAKLPIPGTLSQEWTALQNLPSLPRDLTTVDLGVGCDPDDDDASCARCGVPRKWGVHRMDARAR